MERKEIVRRLQGMREAKLQTLEKVRSNRSTIPSVKAGWIIDLQTDVRALQEAIALLIEHATPDSE